MKHKSILRISTQTRTIFYLRCAAYFLRGESSPLRNASQQMHRDSDLKYVCYADPNLAPRLDVTSLECNP